MIIFFAGFDRYGHSIVFPNEQGGRRNNPASAPEPVSGHRFVLHDALESHPGAPSQRHLDNAVQTRADQNGFPPSKLHPKIRRKHRSKTHPSNLPEQPSVQRRHGFLPRRLRLRRRVQRLFPSDEDGPARGVPSRDDGRAARNVLLRPTVAHRKNHPGHGRSQVQVRTEQSGASRMGGSFPSDRLSNVPNFARQRKAKCPKRIAVAGTLSGLLSPGPLDSFWTAVMHQWTFRVSVHVDGIDGYARRRYPTSSAGEDFRNAGVLSAR